MTVDTKAANWFERLTGFREGSYDSTRARLAIENNELVSLVSGQRHGVGTLDLVELRAMRERSGKCRDAGRRTSVRCLAGDVRALHADPANAGAVFQVASQFNLLEMTSPNVSPEDGVTRYMHDRTQGPACAIAAGAATIYRNYFAPVGGGSGQTAARQIDALAVLGESLSSLLARPVSALWTMRNGYALCTAEGLADIGRWLARSDESAVDDLRARLAIGLHCGVEVTDADGPPRQSVTQAFCSALPVAYSRIAPPAWAPFARLVLEAAYEATLLAACEQAHGGGSHRVLLTRLGGGVFGNEEAWIDAALVRALRLVERAGLDVILLSYGAIHPSMRSIADEWEARQSQNCGASRS